MSDYGFILSVIIIALAGIGLMLWSNHNMNKEADMCRLIADSLFFFCEDYRQVHDELPVSLLVTLPDGRMIFEAVKENLGFKIQKDVSLSADFLAINYHGSEIGYKRVSVMGLEGYHIYIDWHLVHSVIRHQYHPWDGE